MCGIAGIIGSQSAPEELGRILQRMGDSLVHRGPDEQGRLLVPEMRAGLISLRLSIVDLETGRQPIANEDGTVHIVVNGEIYNHRRLRQELEQLGHRFRSHSDSEVVVHLYEQYGDDFLLRLDGMFALAVLDVPRRRLLLARDRIGMKPLYFARHGEAFIFGSEIKALFAGGLKAAPDLAGIDAYLAMGQVPAPRTCFDRVQKLPAGHCAVLDAKGVSTRAYWRFTFDHSPTRGKEADYADELQSLLDAAVASHLDADVPVGALVSGGVDSSLIACAASRVSKGPLKTFSIVFPDAPEVDERRFQHALVEHIGSEHSEVEFHAGDIPKLLRKIIYHQDVPSLSYPSIVKYRLDEMVSASVKAVLSGEGSDELFAGYTWLAGPPYQGLRRAVPSFLARLPANYFTHVKWGRLFRVLAADSETASIAEISRVFTAREKRAVIDLDLPLGSLDLADFRPQQQTLDSCSCDLQRRMALDLATRFPDGLLMVNDRISMAHSLEVRMPFLDNSIIDFARRLPPDLARRGHQEKYILSLLTGQLPQVLAKRKKQPLSSPDHRYFRGPLRQWVRDVLLAPNPGSPLNRRAVEKRLDGWLDGSDYYMRRVRTLLAFQLWWNLHFGPGDLGTT